MCTHLNMAFKGESTNNFEGMEQKRSFLRHSEISPLTFRNQTLDVPNKPSDNQDQKNNDL